VDPFEFHSGNRETRAAFRRQVRLQIYLPLAVGALALAGLVAVMWRSQYGDTSVWADVSLSLLLIVGFGLGILVLALVSAAAFGVWFAVRELPRPFHEAQIAIARAEHSIGLAADKAVLPLIVPKAAWHAILSMLRYLMGIFGRTIS
jgi:hypothetical protein